MICHACKQRPPVYQYANGMLLCLDCAYKHSQMIDSQQRGMERMINFLMDEMEMVSGVKLGGPRFPEPSPPVIQNRPTNITHQIKVDRSVIGAVNTGTISSLNQSMSNVQNNVNDGLAKVIKLVVDKILALDELNKEQKQEFIEKVDFLTEQLAVPKVNRKWSLIKETLDWINRLAATSKSVSQIWLLAKAAFDAFFQK